MALMLWDKRLEMGNAQIDEQHKALVEALKNLNAAMNQGKGKDEVAKNLVFPWDYTVSHFKLEEGQMERSDYPATASHKKIHADLISQVADLVERFEKGTTALTLPVMNFLEDWLTKHIMEEDFRLA